MPETRERHVKSLAETCPLAKGAAARLTAIHSFSLRSRQGLTSRCYHVAGQFLGKARRIELDEVLLPFRVGLHRDSPVVLLRPRWGDFGARNRGDFQRLLELQREMDSQIVDIQESQNGRGDPELARLVRATQPFHNEVQAKNEITLPFASLVKGNGVDVAVVPRHRSEIGFGPSALVSHVALETRAV